MNRNVILAVAFGGAMSILSALDRASASPGDAEQLREIEQDWADAYVKRDTSFAQTITSDDFAFVGPDGNVVKKDDYIKSMTGDTIFAEFKLENLNVRIYGETAVVIGTCAIKAQAKEEDESGKFSFTDVFMKQKGEWKAVSGQVTPVAQDAATE
jgi:ketosteroid isomerase-like protein